MTSIRKNPPTRTKFKEDVEGAQTFFIALQLPLSVIQGALTLSLLIRSISSPQTRIHYLYLWIGICLASGLAWITAAISIFVFQTLHNMYIPSRTSTWLIRVLHTLWPLWLVVAILLATTPSSCQNISYCAHHRAVMAFSIVICLLAVISAIGLRLDINGSLVNQPDIPGGNQAPGSEAPLANLPTKTDESQNSVEPMSGPAEEDSKECLEKHAPQMKFVELEKGQDCYKERLDGA